MSTGAMPPSVAAVLALFDAVDRRDVDDLVALLDEDVLVRPPGFLLGKREERGRAAVIAGFADLESVIGRDRELEFRNRRFFVDGADESKVLAVSEMRISVERGLPFGAEAVMLVTFAAGKATSLESCATTEEGLALLGDPTEVVVAPGSESA